MCIRDRQYTIKNINQSSILIFKLLKLLQLWCIYYEWCLYYARKITLARHVSEVNLHAPQIVQTTSWSWTYKLASKTYLSFVCMCVACVSSNKINNLIYNYKELYKIKILITPIKDRSVTKIKRNVCEQKNVLRRCV